jgi:hypothetical protein
MPPKLRAVKRAKKDMKKPAARKELEPVNDTPQVLY